MRRGLTSLGFATLIGATVGLAAWPAASAPAQDAVQTITLSEAARQLSAATNATIDWDEANFGWIRVQIAGPPATGDAVLPWFMSVCEVAGMAASKLGTDQGRPQLAVAGAREARAQPMRVVTAAAARANPKLLPDCDEFAALHYTVRHADARFLSNAIRPLLDPNRGGRIELASDADGDHLVITDYSPNLRRLLFILDQADRPNRPARQTEKDD